jgi:hypothetical protein
MRAAFEARDAQTEAALDPILFEHRDMMYAQYLELPLSLGEKQVARPIDLS